MNSAAPTLLRWTRFASNSRGTGAEKRSAQIRALCEDAGLGLVDMQPPAAVPRWRVWVGGLAARLRLGAGASVDRAGPGLLGYRAAFYRDALARHQGARVLLWETTYDSLLPALAGAAGYRVVALPHNLESFVTATAFANPGRQTFLALADEVARLAAADAIFTISKEERWLLETQRLGPHYLPFFPDPVLADDCRQVRTRRESRARPDGSVAGPLLLLGSAFNPATARGMRRQMEWLLEAGAPGGGITVAGNQTETVFADMAGRGVRLLGSVSTEVLQGLLGDCGALLVDTEGGAGAVTRIPEALLAGVPVIANTNAGRDQFGTSGVHVYDGPTEFQALVRRPLPVPPAPPRPAAEQERFQQTLRRLAAANQAHRRPAR